VALNPSEGDNLAPGDACIPNSHARHAHQEITEVYARLGVLTGDPCKETGGIISWRPPEDPSPVDLGLVAFGI
jgi:hypothetical protein